MYIFLLLILFLVFPVSISASDPPTLISPANNSQVTTSTISWKEPSYPLYSTNPYRIQIDNNANFSSPEKDTTSKNLEYTPQGLDLITWFWHIKTKDLSGTWSDWSETWQFTLLAPTPIPTPQTTPLEAPSPSPTQAVAKQFLVSNVPSSINTSDSFTIQISIVDKPNTQFLLKGAFSSPNSSNYFGFIKVADNWVKNSAPSTSQFPVTTDNNGFWNGSIEVMPDSADSGYTGSGDYLFKAGKYNNDGTGLAWSSQTSIHITGDVPQPTPTITKSPTASTTIKSNSNTLVTASKQSSTSATTSALVDTPIASIEGESTSSSTESILLPHSSTSKGSTSYLKIILIIIGVLFFGGAGILIKYKYV
jgi:hypothetical protein